MALPHSSAPDTDLLGRLRDSDESALAELIQLYAAPMTMTAYGVLGSRDLAEDVVQTVFVRIWRGRANLRDPVNLLFYLKRAVYNQALTQFRTESREARRRIAASHEDALPHSQVTDAYRTLSSDELSGIVSKAIESLPGRTGEIFRLWWNGDHSYAEIAELLGISIKGVEQGRSRAIATLRKKLRGYWP